MRGFKDLRVSDGLASLAAVCILLFWSLAAKACSTIDQPAAQGAGVAASRSVAVDELVALRGLTGLSLSPDGRYAAVREDHQSIEDDKTVLRWLVIRLSDGKVVHEADGGEPRWSVNGNLAYEMPQWSANGQWLYFRAARDQQAQIWRVHRDGGESMQVTRDEADVRTFIVAADDKLHYATGGATRREIIDAETAETDSGVFIDPTILRGFPLAGSFPVNGRMATFRKLLPGNLNFGRTTLLGDRPMRFMTVESDAAQTGSASDAISHLLEDLWTQSFGDVLPLDPAADRQMHTAHNERFAQLAQSAGDGRSGGASRSGLVLSWRRQAGDTQVRCSVAVCQDADAISLIGWRQNGRDLVFQTRTFGATGLHVWNTDSNQVETIAATEASLGYHEAGVAGVCRLAPAELICLKSAADLPPRLVAIDFDMHEERVLFDPNPNLTPNRLGVAEKLSLSDRFGNTTFARIILPHAQPNGPAPLVITSYSCDGFLQGGSGRDVPEHVLAGLGYVAACVDHGVNVRRDPGYRSGGDIGNRSALDFFEDAVRQLVERGVGDPQRVTLTGFSGSSTATVYALTHSDKFVAAAITTEAAGDVLGCYLTDYLGTCRRLAESAGLGRPYDSRTGYFAGSAAWNVEKITTPLLMQLPESEYESMFQLYGAMVDQGRAVEMRAYPNTYHFKNRPRQRRAVYNRNIDWINFWSKGMAPGDPLRDGQVARWGRLREQQCNLFRSANAPVRAPWFCR